MCFPQVPMLITEKVNVKRLPPLYLERSIFPQFILELHTHSPKDTKWVFSSSECAIRSKSVGSPPGYKLLYEVECRGSTDLAFPRALPLALWKLFQQPSLVKGLQKQERFWGRESAALICWPAGHKSPLTDGMEKKNKSAERIKHKRIF